MSVACSVATNQLSYCYQANKNLTCSGASNVDLYCCQSNDCQRRAQWLQVNIPTVVSQMTVCGVLSGSRWISRVLSVKWMSVACSVAPGEYLECCPSNECLWRAQWLQVNIPSVVSQMNVCGVLSGSRWISRVLSAKWMSVTSSMVPGE